MLKSQFDTAIIYQLPIIIAFKSCPGSSQESLLWGSLCCLVHGETWSWKNSKEVMFASAPLLTLTLMSSMLLWWGSLTCAGWWGSWFCPLDLYCCLCWPLIFNLWTWCERFSWQNQYFPNGLERNCLHGGFLLESPWGSSGWSWKELDSMLWASWVVDTLLDLDLEGLPLPFLPLDLLLPQGWLPAAVLGAFLLWPTTCTEMVFISTLVTFPVPGRAFSWQVRHLPHLPHVLPLQPLDLCTHYLSWIWRIWSHQWWSPGSLLHWTCVCWSPRWLPHAPWHVSVDCHTWGCLVLWCLKIWPTVLTSKCLVAWKRSSCHHIFFSGLQGITHLSMRSLICWSSWLMVSCSPCLMLLYILSM